MNQKNTISTMKKKSIYLSFILIAISHTLYAQVASDYKRNIKYKISLPAEFIQSSEGFVFSTPSFMPSPLKFSIGNFKPNSLETGLLENNISSSEKHSIKPFNAIIASIISGKNIARYRSGSISNSGIQHYGINFYLTGYGHKISIQAEAFRSFNAAISKTGFTDQNDIVEAQSSEVLRDSVLLVGIIKMADSTHWNIELDYSRDKDTLALSGKIYNNNDTYLVKDQTLDQSGNLLNVHLNYPGMIITKEDKIVSATAFPFGYGDNGSVLFSNDLPLRQRPVFIAASALLFSYWRSVHNK